MKYTFTIFLLLLVTNIRAQHVRLSSRETRYPDAADYDIIGRINDHYLIYLEGTNKAEIGVYDDEMKKIRSMPANLLKTKAIHSDFFAYQDHYQVFFQYALDSSSYIGTLRGDGDGGVGTMTVLDSLRFSINVTSFMGSSQAIKPAITLPPMFKVLRSENKQWFMILKYLGAGNKGQQLEATLYDQNLKSVEHIRFNYSQDIDSGEPSEFILDNDGDLAFLISRVENQGPHKIIDANLIFKPRGKDTIVSQELSVPDVILDKLVLRADNANHRYILSSLYYDWGKANLTGLYSLIWDKRSLSPASSTLTPVPAAILSEAGSNITLPDQVLNQYYLRKLIPLVDGGFMILAEQCYQTEQIGFDQDGLHRYDFIQADNAFHKLSGSWISTGWDRIGSFISTGTGRHTDNLMLFLMDQDGKAKNIKIIHKAERTTPGMETLSFQSFNDGKAIHLMYNVFIKGHWLPTGISINSAGDIGQDPVLPGLDRDQMLFPRFGKQVAFNKAIIPGQDRGHLFFALVDY